jgi:hypothetical protein
MSTSNNFIALSFFSKKIRSRENISRKIPCPTSPNITPNKKGNVTTVITAIVANN